MWEGERRYFLFLPFNFSLSLSQGKNNYWREEEGIGRHDTRKVLSDQLLFSSN